MAAPTPPVRQATDSLQPIPGELSQRQGRPLPEPPGLRTTRADTRAIAVPARHGGGRGCEAEVIHPATADVDESDAPSSFFVLRRPPCALRRRDHRSRSGHIVQLHAARRSTSTSTYFGLEAFQTATADIAPSSARTSWPRATAARLCAVISSTAPPTSRCSRSCSTANWSRTRSSTSSTSGRSRRPHRRADLPGSRPRRPRPCRGLKIGALPIKLALISQSTVSATLGQQALDQGLKAGLVGSPSSSAS